MLTLRKHRKANFKKESRLWEKGYGLVAGVDEVGRGSFAGPVVAGCVVFSPTFKGFSLQGGIRINDSKKLTPRQRGKADIWIKENALAWGVGEAPVSLINRIGMGRATKVAFRRAIKAASRILSDKDIKILREDTRNIAISKYRYIDFLLADAFYIPYVRGLTLKNQKAIVQGDEKSISIAAASIIAKVYRDKLMTGLGKKPKYKKYGWIQNKGYGTKKHRDAIKKYGLTRYHRKVFVETFLRNQKLHPRRISTLSLNTN